MKRILYAIDRALLLQEFKAPPESTYFYNPHPPSQFLRYFRKVLKDKGYSFEIADNVPNSSLDDVEWIIFTSVSTLGSRSYPTSLRLKKIKHALTNTVHKSDILRNLASQILGRTVPFRRELYDECLRAGLRDRMIFCHQEPPAVIPEDWLPEVHEKFSTILTYATHLIDNKKYTHFNWPSLFPTNTAPDLSFEQKKFLVCILSNKKFQHSHPSGLYSERHHAIRYFEDNFSSLFDLYGKGWNAPASKIEKLLPFLVKKYECYRGPAMQTTDTYRHYKFALMYENSTFPGFISERIFEGMVGGCVPVYWGASDVERFIPTGTFVDRRCFKNNIELGKYLSSMSKAEYETYRGKIRDFLSSEQIKPFTFEYASSVLLRVMGIESRERQ